MLWTNPDPGTVSFADAVITALIRGGLLLFWVARQQADLAGAQSLREVIAFPKTTSASALLEGAPSPVADAELADLHLRLIPPGGRA